MRVVPSAVSESWGVGRAKARMFGVDGLVKSTRGCRIRYIMTEISSEEHYSGGCTEQDLHAFLTSHGFRLIQRKLPPIGHGNGFYVRA